MPAKPKTVTLQLVPTATVYVCVENGTGTKLIAGRVFAAGETIPTEKASKLLITLGNSSVQMKVNGKTVQVAQGSPIGYSITPSADDAVAIRPTADLHMSERASVRAGILVTGTEVLTGIISDRNGPWLSERLREVGVDAAMIHVVGDRPEDLLASLEYMRREGMAVVITSGGLGPTADDLTAEIVGRFCGREMVLDDELEAQDRRDPAAAAATLARISIRTRFASQTASRR